MTKIIRNVRNKKMLLPKEKRKRKSYDATNNAVKTFYNATKVTFLLFKPFTNPMRRMCNPYPMCSIKSGMYTALCGPAETVMLIVLHG